jgi:hypothetical protein
MPIIQQGMNQQTPAVQNTIRSAFGRMAGTMRRRTRTKKKATAKRRIAKKSGSRKLKFGSPAWRKKYLKK